MSEERNQIPSSWVMTTLGEVTEPNRPRHSPQDYPHLPFLGMEHIEPHTMKLLGKVAAGVMKSSAVHFRPGDVLYGRLRPYLRKIFSPSFEGLCSAEFIVFPAQKHLSAKYLQYFLASPSFTAFAHHLSEGDRPRIDFSQISRCPFPLPPLPEQERLGEEIDKQFTRLDAGVETLRRARTALGRYRASVLKAACEGRLVPTEAELARAEGRGYEPAEQLLHKTLEQRRSTWLSQGHDLSKYQEPEPARTDDLPILPEGWIWATWNQIGFCQNGHFFPSSAYQSDGVKLLRPGNLSEEGTVSWTPQNTRHLSEEWAAKHPGHLIGPGELVMNLTAQSLRDEFLGRICMTGLNERCLLNQRIARLTPVGISPRFLLWIFKSPLFRRYVDGLNKGSLIQHMFTSQIKEFRLPLPPLAEQERIADEIERRLSLLNIVALSIDNFKRRSDQLRQGILQWAFQGRMLPQDPTDESATVLLDRIREARQEGDTAGRQGKQKPHQKRSGVEISSSRSEVKVQSTPPPPPAIEPDSEKPPFVEQDPSEQLELAWSLLFGRGLFEKQAAVRSIAEGLRDQGLAHFQRLRKDGPLFNDIASAIDRGVRQGFFDRPKRGHVRAILADPKAYSPDDWRFCLLGALDGAPIEKEDALRAAAELARETMGLEFARLREDGVILRSLRAALKEAVGRGEVERVGRGRIRRAG